VTGGIAREVLSWLLPAASGALIGFLLGTLVLGRVARAVMRGSRTRIARTVSDQAGSLGSRVLGLRAAAAVPAPGSPSARKVEEAIAGVLAGILGSRGTIYAVRDAVGGLVGGLAGRGMSDVSRELGIERLLSDKILAALAAQPNRRSIAAAAGALVAGQAGTAVDDTVIRELSGVVDSAVPEAADAVVRWLHSRETRDDLSARGRELLPRILEKLSELQKLFLSAAQFDRRLDEKMPEIVDETVRALERMVRDPGQQKRVAAVFEDAARGWRDSLLVSPAGPGRPWNERQQKLSDAVSSLVERFLERLEDPGERETLAGRAAARLEKDRRSLGSFLREQAGLREQDIVEAVSDRVLRLLTSPQTARNLAGHLYGLLRSRAGEDPDATIGSVLGIDEARREELGAMLRSAAPGLVERVLPAVLEQPASRRGMDLFLGACGAGLGLAVGLALAIFRVAGVL